MSGQTLVANMMVYNEKQFLPLVTDLLLRFCDHVIVQDNGSTDGSREWIANRDQIQAIMTQQTDPLHYAQLRNSMLDHVPDGSWVLKWDPDEIPSQGMLDGFRSFLERATSDDPKVDSVLVPIYHLLRSCDECMTKDFGKLHLRAFRKTPATKFVNRVHERIVGTKFPKSAEEEKGIAFLHLNLLAVRRIKRKDRHYAKVDPRNFPSVGCLLEKLKRPTMPLPEHVELPVDRIVIESLVAGAE